MKKMTTSPRWRVALTSAVSAAVLVAAPLVGAQTAHAQPPSPRCHSYPPVPRQLTLSRTVVPAGGTLTFRGNCFAPFEQVVAELHSHEVVLGRFRADAEGVVTGKVTIPRKTTPGDHTFELEGPKSRLQLFAHIKVLRVRHEQGGRGPEQSDWSDGSNGSDHRDGQGGPGQHDSAGRGNSHHRSALAATGSEQALAGTGSEQALAATGSQALAVSGITAGLIAAGGGTMLAVRRRRSS
ncbi:LPXTG cell wall anchor domain-containing protein [Streptomyces sp. NPDC032472]|uniref:LPXTG cell wall anchor domain-containing protein n=1 Tax=Streptomyces sp. NPDC032472 TaxID=3155018 RepID=UPI0033C04DDE